MKRFGFNSWEKVDVDPRDLSVSNSKSTRVVTTHVLLWLLQKDKRPIVIHVVNFYKRKDHYWHSALKELPPALPFNMTDASFGRSAGLFSR